MIPNGGFPMKHQKLSTTPEISKRMANVHLKASKAETDLAKELWRRGLRYRTDTADTRWRARCSGTVSSWIGNRRSRIRICSGSEAV